MNTPSWMKSDLEPRMRARRSPGRGAYRRPSAIALLGAGALVAWVWVAYEVVRLFMR